MIYNNHYLNKLYNDLVTNSPKTISMNIPSDIGQTIYGKDCFTPIYQHGRRKRAESRKEDFSCLRIELQH